MIICLTQENRKDRHRTVKREFKKWNIEPEYFYAVKAIGPHQSFTLSMKAILEKLTEDSLVFEDDVCMVHPKEIFETAKKDLPDNWDLLYLGANILGKPEKITANLFRLSDVRTTHAIYYKHASVQKILDSFPNENEIMYDEYLSDLKLNAYIVNPMCCVQSPGHSDLWNEQVNYNAIWRASQNKLV